MRSPAVPSRISLAVVLALLGACGEEVTSDPGPAGTPSSSGLCVRDGASIAAGAPCRADDQCPCGAHCELGACRADCLGDADCGGGRCDDFGYCRKAGDSAVVKPLAPKKKEGELVVAPARVTSVVLEAATQKVRLTPKLFAIGKVRVLADAGLEVKCDSTRDFATECFLDRIELGSEILLEVRSSGSFAPGEVRILRVFSGTRMDTVSFAAPEEPPPAEPVEGTYGGAAELLASGVGEGEPAELPRALAVPVTAKLFGGTGGDAVLVIEDASRMLHPAGVLVGAATLGASPAAHFPAFREHAATLFAGADVEIMVQSDPAPLVVHERPRTIRFELVRRHTGALPADRAPWSRWRISLSRTGDVSGSAPAVPADELPALDVGRAGQPFPWEVSVRAAFPRVSLNTAELQENLLRCYRDPSESCTPMPGLHGCQLDAGERGVLAARASLESWPNDRIVVDQGRLRASRTVGVFDCPPNQRIRSVDLAADANPVLAAIGQALPDGTLCAASVDHSSITLDLPQGAGAACSFVPDRTQRLSGRIVPIDQAFDDYVLDAALRPPAVESCEQLAQDTGCIPVHLDDPIDAELLTWRFAAYRKDSLPAVYEDTIDQSGTLRGLITGACVLVPQGECSELASCAAGGKESTFTDTRGELSGELVCGHGSRAAGFEMDRNADLPITNAERLPADEMLDACYADLARLEAQAPPAAPDPYDVDTLFAGGSCVDGARFVVALGAATRADRDRYADAQAPTDERASAHAHRLLQRWVLLHGWIAREAVEQEQMAEVIRAAPVAGVDPPRPIEDVLARSLAGWSLFLHPRVAAALETMPAGVLEAPDYRPRVIGQPVAAKPHEEHPVGLSVAMLEALQAQLELADLRIQQALFTGDRTAIDTVAGVLERVVLVRPVAMDLAARAGNAAWKPRLAAADAVVTELAASLLARLAHLREGRNPFGIEESDLPLYFFGDATGPNGRFAAISDYLLGKPGDTSAWAPAMVAQARAAEAAARAAWVEEQRRQLQIRLDVRDQAERLEAVQGDYGAKILELCGSQPDTTAEDVLSMPDLDPARCYLRTEDPACQVTEAEWLGLLTAHDVEHQVCQVHALKQALGEGARFADPRLDEVARSYGQCERFGLETCDQGTCARCELPGQDAVAPIGFTNLHAILHPGAPRSVIETARDACSARLPTGRPEVPGTDELADETLEKGECYRGSLGEMALTVRRAAKEIEIARSQFTELHDAYDIAMNSCIILQAGNDQIEQATAAHNDTMKGLRIAKAVADSAAAAAAAVKDCASTVSGAAADVFLGGTASAVSCGAAAVEATATIVSVGLQTRMDNVQAEHDALVLGLGNEVAEQQCFNDAEQHLVGLRTATLQIEAASVDMQLALKGLREGQRAVPALYAEGRAQRGTVEGREIVAPSHDYWVDESVSTFSRKMRLAKRTTYLAVRAVEWEFQQSMSARAEVLAASLPEQLQKVLEDLWLAAGTRRINGSSPTDLKVVLSLRDHILQLADRSGDPRETLRLSDVERFRSLLVSPRYAVLDADGNYLGQQIPFTLAPLGRIGLGETQGIQVLAGSDCAERLWSVNASIVGQDGMYLGSPQTFTRIDLLKSNSFYSQWCQDPGPEGPEFQVASVRPSHNLFRDPGLGAEVGSQFGVDSPAEQYSRARIEAYFNVPQGAFESDDYANGDTSELAARGLYGQYALYLPAAVLSVEGESGPSPGLVLNQVDDILLRLDYVSVAR